MTRQSKRQGRDDNPYDALVEAEADSRWAFGTGFDDPLEGVDTTVPDGVDAAALSAQCLDLGDDSLVLAQRLQQWCARAPELEEEVSLANIALDLLGQTRLLYARAAAAAPLCVPSLPEDSPVPAEDRLAFFRDAGSFRCVGLVQLPDEDFADAVVRVQAFAAWRMQVFAALAASPDPVLSAVARKAATETRYHQEWADHWVRVLDGGTEGSQRRCARARATLAPYVAQLRAPGEGREATPWLPELVGEMQSLARRHPRGRW